MIPMPPPRPIKPANPLIYTGVGSRTTPPSVLARMTQLAYDLGTLSQVGKQDYTVRSGNADGADTAFQRGAAEAESSVIIFMPWAKFNGGCLPSGPGARWVLYPSKAAMEMAYDFHPAWNRLDPVAKLLHARNLHQVLGADLDEPSAFLVCWTPDGAESKKETSEETGGTGTAIRVADAYGVPVFNLCNEGAEEDLRAQIGLDMEGNPL